MGDLAGSKFTQQLMGAETSCLEIVLCTAWPVNTLNFIKNVVAVAAYSRLASRSQAKFQTMKLSPLSALRAAAPAQSTISTCRSLRFSPRSCSDVNLTRTVPVAFPGIFEARNEVNWWLLTSLVSRSQEWAFFHITFDIKRLLVRLVWRVVRCLSTKQDGGTTWPIFDGCSTPDRTARLHGKGRLHSVTGPSRPAQQVDGSAGKRDSSSRLGEGWRVVSAGDESAGGHDSAANDEPEIVDDPAGVADPAHDVDDPAHAPEEVLQLPAKRLGDGSFQVRESHDNPRSPWLPACLWWDGPAKTGQNTTDQEMGIAGKGWRASCPGYPSREHCKIGVFHVIWCQQFVLPVNGQAIVSQDRQEENYHCDLFAGPAASSWWSCSNDGSSAGDGRPGR